MENSLNTDRQGIRRKYCTLPAPPTATLLKMILLKSDLLLLNMKGAILHYEYFIVILLLRFV